MCVFYVVNAEGLSLHKRRKMFKKVNTTKTVVTSDDLKRLEDAIWANRDTRVKFLDHYTRFASDGARGARMRALEHCWNDLRWRPRQNLGSIYIKHPLNRWDKNY